MDAKPPPAAAPLDTTARLLGYAGLAPQLLCLVMVLAGHEWRYAALGGSFAYAAAIFSFLGGVWWGQAVQSGRTGAGAYLLAVLPSLIALALFLPWTFGWEWPGPALLYLGALIALSPMVDRALGFASPDFLRLRWHLSLGLGSLTIALGLLSRQVVDPPLDPAIAML
ncbi:DUF3429 domain-containing protein [Erythrobacter tepidarius]|uniref:DUF3429 domain-containing protein n=1 Tax=Erythrobacter tepidarius TaxID=60454 RepID=UPI000A3B9FA3|nr:DUF3429 domain-containing protein [Erythrobacter tepidarius]